MKTLALLLGLQALASAGLAQTSDWLDLTPPQASVVGKLVRAGALVGDALPASELETVAGPDTYRQEATRHFKLTLPVSNFAHSRFARVHIDTMMVDYLSDKTLFRNPDYLTTNFVYKAIRAKSITYYYATSTVTTLRLDELIPGNVLTQFKQVFPQAGSITPSRTARDTIALTITNPRVYFRALVMQLVKDCNNCRQSFRTNLSATTGYVLDLADQANTATAIYVPMGTQPTFQLYVAQDPVNTTQLKLFLDIDEDFLKVNHSRISSPLEIPYQSISIGNRLRRRFKTTPVEYYLGTINSGTKRLWSDVSLNIPVYVSVTAEQVSDTKVQLLTAFPSGMLATKLEYTPYRYTVYRGRVQ